MKKKKKSNRLRTYVICLKNHVDHRDDETIRVRACSSWAAVLAAKFDTSRFSVGRVMTAAEYKKFY